MINYLIVDDEPQARKLLQAYLQDISALNLVKLCSNAMEAYEALQTSKIDLMFLDIKMAVVSGADFLRSLKNPPLVIFTTAFNKYAMEGYELNVVDYLLKPIALPRLLNALEKVRERLDTTQTAKQNTGPGYMFLKVENKLVKVNFNEILLVEGLQNYVKIHVPGKAIIIQQTMKAVEQHLLNGDFIRVHRSYIIPKKSIIAINGNTIETTYQDVPIGVSFKPAVMTLVTGR